MLRVVLDVNILISVAISQEGPPSRIVRAALEGSFELLVSPKLVAELDDVLARPRIVAMLRQPEAEAEAEAVALRRAVLAAAIWLDDPVAQRYVPADAGDDYIVGLAREGGAHVVVTGDRHLHDAEFAQVVRVLSPADFVRLLQL